MESDGVQRIFDLVGNGGQEGGLGIIKGAQAADSVPPEGAAADYIPSDEDREHCRRQYLQRQTPEEYLPAGQLPWQKELQCPENGTQSDTVLYIG